MTELYIISGFLGAGKTTLINKLLKESFKTGKTVIVENDFGEAGVDAALLAGTGANVTELNSGCICCTLTGDFIKALLDLLKNAGPASVIIEPSGVALLSDILKACKDPRIASLAHVNKTITVVDAKRCKMQLENFGDFFEDQIENADVLVLSHVEEKNYGYGEEEKESINIIKDLNDHAAIFARAWETIPAEHILEAKKGNTGIERHDHKEDHESHTHIHADDFFETVTVFTEQSFTAEQFEKLAASIEAGYWGEIIRAKGIVRGKDMYYNVQYTSGGENSNLEISKSETPGGAISFIGRNLDRQGLNSLSKVL